MPKQPAFPGLRHAMKKKQTRREPCRSRPSRTTIAPIAGFKCDALLNLPKNPEATFRSSGTNCPYLAKPRISQPKQRWRPGCRALTPISTKPCFQAGFRANRNYLVHLS